jgi:hypothetical protein
MKKCGSDYPAMAAAAHSCATATATASRARGRFGGRGNALVQNTSVEQSRPSNSSPLCGAMWSEGNSKEKVDDAGTCHWRSDSSSVCLLCCFHLDDSFALLFNFCGVFRSILFPPHSSILSWVQPHNLKGLLSLDI